MKLEDYISELLEMMERDDALELDMRIENLSEWDSMARISFISFLDAEFSIEVTPDDLMKCKTVADLVELAKEHIET